MSEKNTNVTETVEIDQAMGVMPEEVDPGMSVMPGPGVADTPTVIPELDSMLAVVLDQLPAYTTTDWKNKPSTATPVTAEIMKKIEQRLVDLTSVYNNQAAEIKALRDSVCQLDSDGSTTECTVKLSSGKEIIITAKNKLGQCVSLNCYASEIVISMLAAMPTALPAYQTTAWKNKPSTETPVDAAVMTRVEQRLVDLTNAVNGLRDSVSRVKLQKKAWSETIEIEMPTDSFALCFCGNSVFGIWRSTYDVFLSNMPIGVTNEKTSTGVKLTRTTGETGWLAIVYR